MTPREKPMEHTPQEPKFLVNRPRRAELEAQLAREGQRLGAVVVRLAWQLGLVRREIHQLTWEQVDFTGSVVVLPDREIPMEPELQVYLQQLHTARGDAAGPVVVSERSGRQPAEQHLSYVCRQLLDRAGQTGVRLLDLRYDYILRQLECHSWQYVSRVAGLDPRTLQLHFSQGWESRQEAPSHGEEQVDAARVEAILAAEGLSACGVAIQLVWRLGLYQEELHQLRWPMVDLAAGEIRLPQRTVAVPPPMIPFFQALREQNQQWSERVLLSDRAHKAVETAYLSKAVRAVLVRGGCDHLTLRDLRRDWELRIRFEQPVLEYLKTHRRIMRRDVMVLTGVSQEQANKGLNRLVSRGVLIRSGHCYYLPGAIVEPEQQEPVILAYLANHPGCQRRHLTKLLGLEAKQCLTILDKLLARGLVQRVGNKFYLPEQQPREPEGAAGEKVLCGVP